LGGWLKARERRGGACDAALRSARSAREGGRERAAQRRRRRRPQERAGQAKFYDDARGSAEECAAILDAASIRGLASLERGLAGRALLHRAVRLLSGLVRSALRRGGA